MNLGSLCLQNPIVGAVIILVLVCIAVGIQLRSDRWFSANDFDRMELNSVLPCLLDLDERRSIKNHRLIRNRILVD